MDFPTRDHYRHVVEKIAKSGKLSEVEVAASAVRLAHESATRKDDRKGSYGRSDHVGYYLIDKGLRSLNIWQRFGCPLRGPKKGKQPVSFVSLSRCDHAGHSGFHRELVGDTRGKESHPWLLLVTFILSLLCTSQLAIGVVNWFATFAREAAGPAADRLSKGIRLNREPGSSRPCSPAHRTLRN